MKLDKKQSLFILLFLLPFITIFFYIIYIYFIIPSGFQNQNSIIMFIGFAIVISAFFLFFILNFNENGKESLTIKFFSENVLKVLLLVLVVFTILISPINFPFTVIAWEEINFLNYIRAIIIVVGCAFLPGSCLFNILLPDNTLSKRFNLEPFFIKITLYPLLSFIFIGILVLILNIVGIVIREIFSIFLFTSIIILCIIDFILQGLRNFENFKIQFINKKISTYIISKNLFLIIFLSLGVCLIALGIHDAIHYLITGDSWTALAPTISIEDPNDNPISQSKITRYPAFWCYISYGLAVLSGIPLININALMAPFCFLFVFIIYLLNKAILNKIKEKYAILSTIIISMFSGMMFISPYYYNKAIVANDLGTISILIFSGQFFFYYKTFALYLSFAAITLYVMANKKLGGKELTEKLKRENITLLSLAAIFLIISYMIYMLPLIPILIFIFFFSIFSKKESQNKNYFLYFLFLILIFFFLFDVLTNSFNSFLFSDKFDDFMVWILSTEKTNKFMLDYLAYYMFFGMIVLSLLINIFINYIQKRNSKQSSRKQYNKLKNIFYNPKTHRNAIILFLIFSTFLIFFALFNVFFKYYIFRFVYVDNYYWLYPIALLLDNLFISFGIFGIFGIYFSYFCYKKEKRIFLILIFWMIFIIFYASIVILIESYEEILYPISPQNIRYDLIKYMLFWFTRNWYFSIIPLSIFFSIGLIKCIKILNKINFPSRYHNEIKIGIKYALLSLLITFSYVNVVFAGINWGSKNSDNTVNDGEAQVIGYIPLYIPKNTQILTENRYPLFHGITTMTSCDYISVGKIFDPDINYKSYIEIINNKSISYAVLNVKEHDGVDPTIGSFLDNFLLQYYFTDKLYQYQNLGIFKYSPIEIEPFHQASIDFMIYADGSGPSEWGNKWRDRSTGDSKVQVISEKEGHLKVLQLTPKSGYAAFRREETNKTSGSVEFWLYTTNTYHNFTFEINQYRMNIMKFLIDNNKWSYVDSSGLVNEIPGLVTSPENNTWHHLRFDFESSDSRYEGLEQFKWQIIIDGIDKSDQIDFNDKVEGIWSFFYFQTDSFDVFSVYIDAIGFSWDEYYELGDNINKSIFNV